MDTLSEIKQKLSQQQEYLVNSYGVTIVGVFGSYARNEQKQGSDVDILIDIVDDSHLDLFDLVRLEKYLTDLLGIKADIAIKRNLRKRIGKRILDEVERL